MRSQLLHHQLLNVKVLDMDVLAIVSADIKYDMAMVSVRDCRILFSNALHCARVILGSCTQIQCWLVSILDTKSLYH